MSSVQIAEWPQSVEGFVGLRDELAQTPQGGAAMMVAALFLYAQNEALGRQCLTVAVDQERLEDGPSGYKGRQLGQHDLRLIESQIKGRPHIPASYIQGATPENGYQLPAPPFEVAVSANPYSGDPNSGVCKVFIATSGASTPRPVTVRRNNRGLWKAQEWSSLIVGVARPTQKAADDDL